MSHVVDYWTSEKKEDIGCLASEFALYNVNRMEDPSGSYHGDLEILENHIYDNYDKALEAAKKIEKKRGVYRDFAIPFYESIQQKPTKQMLNLNTRAQKMEEDMEEYQKKMSIHNLKAKFITCRNCSSKLSKDFLNNSNRCPVCGADLRAEYIVKRLDKYKKDIANLYKQYNDLNNKRSKKGKVKWLVKLEVHC